MLRTVTNSFFSLHFYPLISRGITQEAETTEHHLFAWRPAMYSYGAISVDVELWSHHVSWSHLACSASGFCVGAQQHNISIMHLLILYISNCFNPYLSYLDPILQILKKLKSWICVDIQIWCGVRVTVTGKFLLSHFFLAESNQDGYFAAPLQHWGRFQNLLSSMMPMLFPPCISKMKWLSLDFILCSQFCLPLFYICHGSFVALINFYYGVVTWQFLHW